MSDILFFQHVDHIVKIMSVYVYKSLHTTNRRLEVAYRRKVDLIVNHTSALFSCSINWRLEVDILRRTPASHPLDG